MKQGWILLGLFAAVVTVPAGADAARIVESHLGPPTSFKLRAYISDLDGYCDAIEALPDDYTVDNEAYRWSRYYAARIFAAVREQTTLVPPDATYATAHRRSGNCHLTFDVYRRVNGDRLPLMLIDVDIERVDGHYVAFHTQYAIQSRR